MKKRSQLVIVNFIFFALGLVFIPQNTYSQHLFFQTGKVNWEAGINFGPSFFLGDLGGNKGKGTPFLKDLNLQFTNLMKGVFITAYPTDWVGIRLAAELGKLEGDDGAVNTKGVDELWRKQRNLDFRTNIAEGYIALEFFPLMVFPGIRDQQPRLRPYGVIGAGLFHFNPQGSISDSGGNKTWYYLHPLRTEGEGMSEYPNRKEYKLTQVNIPFGAGLKYLLSDRISISTEFLYRKTFTDYIDDVSRNYIDPNNFSKYLSPEDASIARRVSDKTVGIITPGLTRYAPGTQRGNPKQDDAYFNFFLKIGIRLGESYSSAGAEREAHHMRCPNLF